MPWAAERAREGWKATDQHPAGAEGLGYVPLWDGEEEVTVDARKRAWTRLLAKLCEADPSVARSAAGVSKSSVMTAALIDRVLHHCHIVNMRGAPNEGGEIRHPAWVCSIPPPKRGKTKDRADLLTKNVRTSTLENA
jgi:hypothetical protein